MKELRHQIKLLEILINKAIEDNFGQCPSYQWFNELMDKHQKTWDEIARTDKEWFKNVLLDWEYKVSECGEKWENLPIE